MALIYLVTNTTTQQKYVGFTVQKTLGKRRIAHKYYAKIKKYLTCYFHNALRKYPWECFIWEVLYKNEDAEYTKNVMEPQLILEQQSYYKNGGYNMTLGGDGVLGWKPSKEECERRSKRMKGKNNPFYGKKHPNETRAKISEAKRGFKHTTESRAKMSMAHKGKKFSLEHRTNMSIAKAGKNNPFYGKKHPNETRAKISQAMKKDY